MLYSDLLLLRVRPSPSSDVSWINTVLIRLRLGRNLHIQQLLSDAAGLVVQCRDSVNGVHCQRESISLVANSQLERSVDITLLLVASNVEVELAGSLVGQSVDEPWVGVEVEDDGAVLRED